MTRPLVRRSPSVRRHSHGGRTAATTAAGIGAAIGAFGDRLVAEPGDAVHPVAAFGRAMGWLERRVWRDDRAVGAAFLLAGAVMAGGVGVIAERRLGRTAATAAAATVSIGATMLDRLAGDVAEAIAAGDIDVARRRAGRLVGRDTSELDEAQLARATIESVAENTVDAALAPIVWGTIAGASGVLVHRAINTLDAMVGHRSARYERFGWATAHADDALNWLPARLGAIGVAALRPKRARGVARAVRDDAPAHPSPNGGVIEASFAAALGITLGGTNRYGDRIEDRGTLGTGPVPGGVDIARATDLARRLVTLFAVAAAFPGIVGCAEVERLLRRRASWGSPRRP